MNLGISDLLNTSQAEYSLRDPVCGMQVAADQHAITYQQMHFAFCSMQCKERFLANPHLCIDHPGCKAPNQEGKEILKQRMFKLFEPLSSELEGMVIDQILR